MGTIRKILGYVVVVKPYRKHGNGAKGGGRKGSTGKRCALYKLGAQEPDVEAEGPNAVEAIRNLKKLTQVNPTYVAINHNGETHF